MQPQLKSLPCPHANKFTTPPSPRPNLRNPLPHKASQPFLLPIPNYLEQNKFAAETEVKPSKNRKKQPKKRKISLKRRAGEKTGIRGLGDRERQEE